MAEQFPNSSYAMFAGRLVQIQMAKRRYGTDGYQVLLVGEVEPQAYTHWVPTRDLTRPVIGENVCGQSAHTCGRVHLRPRLLALVSKQAEAVRRG